MLTIYADESGVDKKFMAIGGYVATEQAWKEISKRWGRVLSEYRVKSFHFREFNSKAACAKIGSPYYGWSAKKRDSFFYELAFSIGDKAVPIGGDYPFAKHKDEGLKSDPTQNLIATFLSDVGTALSVHWPHLTLEKSDEKVRLICDINPDRKWTESFVKIYGELRKQDKRFGELIFEDDTNPDHRGLQVADLIAGVYRQGAYDKSETGERRNPRIIDIILFRTLDAPGHGKFNFSFIPPPAFQLMINTLREDERMHKREWEKQGIKGKKYYPLEHADTIFPAIDKAISGAAGKLKIWMQNRYRFQK